MPLAAADIERLIGDAGASGVEVRAGDAGPVARVSLAAVRATLAAFKSAGFESAVDFDGVDTGDDVELTWRLRSYRFDTDCSVKASVPYDGTIESVWGIYPSVLMPERETAELLGLSLDAHPNPKRLFTTDGVPPLLRRDVPIRTPEEFRR